MKTAYEVYILELKMKGDVRGLLELYASEKDEKVRRLAIEAIQDIDLEQRFTKLAIIFLKDDKLCTAAVKAMAEIKEPEVVNYFFQFLLLDEDDNFMPLIKAIASKYCFDPQFDKRIRYPDLKNFVKWLTEIIQQREHPYRKVAIEALGFFQDSSTFELLLSCLRENDLEVRKAATISLVHLDDSRARVPLVRVYESSDKEFREGITLGEDILDVFESRDETLTSDFLVAAFQHQDPDVRLSAAIELGMKGDSMATETLLYHAENDECEKVKIMALYSLANIDSSKAARGIIRALDSESDEIVVEALNIISDYFCPELYSEAEPKIISLLKSSCKKTRENAVEVLEQKGTLAALVAVEEALAREEAAGAADTRFFKLLSRARESMKQRLKDSR